MLACFTHWYTSMLYVAPVLLIVALLGVQSVRDRRKAARDASGEKAVADRGAAPGGAAHSAVVR